MNRSCNKLLRNSIKLHDLCLTSICCLLNYNLHKRKTKPLYTMYSNNVVYVFYCDKPRSVSIILFFVFFWRFIVKDLNLMFNSDRTYVRRLFFLRKWSRPPIARENHSGIGVVVVFSNLWSDR